MKQGIFMEMSNEVFSFNSGLREMSVSSERKDGALD